MSDPQFSALQSPPKEIAGRRRPNNNPLIGSYEVGKSRSAQYSPHFNDPNWTYGMPSRRDVEGAGDVVLSWRAHSRSPPPKGAGGKDFKRMNKRAVTSQCVTAKAQRSFRSEHGIALPQKRLTKDRSLPAAVRDPTKVYGHKTRDEVSVGDLIANKFESEWIETQRVTEQRDLERRQAAKQRAARRQFIHQPKQSIKALEPQEYFTLKKFRDVPSKMKKDKLDRLSPEPFERPTSVDPLPPISP